ncbi:MAG TPA: hypothetical protein EYM92_04180 [Acinetobacter pittii]|nr:hypothetical protein [Acinetobacter pittii]
MNTESNLAQHPCENKCTKFDGEQCKTCLIQDIEKKEFNLGLAPDSEYVKTQVVESDDVQKHLNRAHQARGEVS